MSLLSVGLFTTSFGLYIGILCNGGVFPVFADSVSFGLGVITILLFDSVLLDSVEPSST